MNVIAHYAAPIYMPKANSQQPDDSGLNFEAQLWAAADKMRGHMDASEYKHACRHHHAHVL